MGISSTALKLLWLAERLEREGDKKLCIEASDLIEHLFDKLEKLESISDQIGE